MTRRDWLRLAAAGGAGAVFGTAPVGSAGAAPADFEWLGADVARLSAAMASGEATAVSLTRQYLERIAAVDKAGPALNSVIEVNPDAETIARDLDEERKAKGPRGPLHGVPVLVKDNLDTHDKMTTTAGSLALKGSMPASDGFVVKKLREAGAVLLGKTNLSEWANFRSNSSTSGWSGRGGLTKNPYSLDRNPSGSSSGSAAAVSADLCAVAIGTETDGSIVSPSSVCGVVGVKPTLGLVSRSGIVPIAHSQDTAGPIARTVRDAAVLLGAIAGPDPADPATEPAKDKTPRDYTRALDPGGLRGARIGIVKGFAVPNEKAQAVFKDALSALQHLGAELLGPIEWPWMKELGEAEITVMLYEFKADLNAYLASLGPAAPVRSLQDVIDFNSRNAEQEMPWFGQELLLRAQAKGPLTDKQYLDALETCRRLTRAEGIDAAMDKHRLDALVAPTAGPAARTDLVYGDRDVGGSSTPAAVAGYPSVTVPAGQVAGLPVGISFFGRPWSEPALLKFAFAFEQGTKARRAPRFVAMVG